MCSVHLNTFYYSGDIDKLDAQKSNIYKKTVKNNQSWNLTKPLSMTAMPSTRTSAMQL